MVPMRMQWWRDAVNGLYKAKPIKHPAIQCLHQVRWRPGHTAKALLVQSARPALCACLGRRHAQLQLAGCSASPAEMVVDVVPAGVTSGRLLGLTAKHRSTATRGVS